MNEKLLALVQLGRILQAQRYRFVTGTPQTHGIVNARPENREASNLSGVFGWNRPFRRKSVDAEILSLMETADILVPVDSQHERSAVRWSTLGGQLYVHSGYPTNQEDAVYFGPDTYRFVRMIDEFLTTRPAIDIRRAVDIGCGAGPAAVHLCASLPAADVTALDINPRALDFTRVNSTLAGFDRLHIVQSDLLQNADGRFDLMVANPPYMVDSERRLYRDGGSELGSALSLRILESALARLDHNGSLLLYTGSAITPAGDPFRERVSQILASLSGFTWSYAEIDPDVYGNDLLNAGYEEVERISVVALTVTRIA